MADLYSPNLSSSSRQVSRLPEPFEPIAADEEQLIYLNNVPLVTGACYTKWHLPSSSATEHRGKTHRAPIKEHLVTWDYEKRVELRLTVDKHGNLQGSEIEFEVVQEYAVGAKGERATLGVVKLNLAEYVLACDEAEEPVCRRYLMHESKINSTVKVGDLWTRNGKGRADELEDLDLDFADRRREELCRVGR